MNLNSSAAVAATHSVRVLHCLSCESFWMQSGNMLICFRCQSDFVEIVTTGNRNSFQGQIIERHPAQAMAQPRHAQNAQSQSGTSSGAMQKLPMPLVTPTVQGNRENSMLSVGSSQIPTARVLPLQVLTSFHHQQARPLMQENRAPVTASTSGAQNSQQKEPSAKPLTAAELKTIPRVFVNDLIHGEKECPICYEEYGDRYVIRQLQECKHSFHQKCVFPWLAKDGTCPICRRRAIGVSTA